MPFDLPTEIVDRDAYESVVQTLKSSRVVLPTFTQLTEPWRIPDRISGMLEAVDPDAPHPANLFRVHWYNDEARRGRVRDAPGYLLLTEAVTGVSAPIAVILGRRFPMIGAHKVLAAYGCLAPRLVSGAFDPQRHRAVWPSTGNYCRGGVAISRILGCRGVAVLPAGMSVERFQWLERWVGSTEDIVRTPGSESNVKEIYDQCAVLAREPSNQVLNQFSEFGNYLAHYLCTGRALEHVYDHLCTAFGDVRLAAFVAGTGSAGTLGAGDYLKERHGTRVVAVEPLECPTMLYNGYGEHNIQGIGDKHIPLIHNVMNTDIVAGVSDVNSDCLNVLFNTEPGREYLVRRKKIDRDTVEGLGGLGLSGIANVLAAIKTARRLELGSRDLVVTVATDGAELYASEQQKTVERRFDGVFDEVDAAEAYGRYLAGVDGDHLAELTRRDRRRIFNLGYYTWVEQQGVALGDFDARLDQGFWSGLHSALPLWDELIEELNERTGVDLPG
ncbi:MAG: pyridoxal-phosphate dependent enzyme [Gammaproteobacteria bacterium]|nr:pyridoxal-phosphate dependent enzyme [Gammaproteobacteria bacterium]NIR85592.1 pyridoxal-phosphate dependent enzyme [Gammaproteobacteria bacterium]NIR90033.1 pyridoxal-phosphate dependent enzyme [Gammaproteobacteria bacterium]NIU06721.1 pyridoxal-phosphate dependent enzyme [Gammaproteobacteria bacterium]NIV53652.1 pyridoxal-phosphate dependent enzyme [Gammaproteobacteria bacterium]